MKSPAATRAMAAVAVLFLFAACKDSGDASPPVSGATVPTVAPTTTTTNPYAVPAVIDAAYVNRVLAGLDGIEAEIVSSIRATRSVTPEAIDRIKAYHTNLGTAEIKINLLQFELARGFSSRLPGNGITKTTVTRLITVRPSCVYAEVDRDVSAVVSSTNPATRRQWVAIRPVDRNDLNRVGWGFEYNGFDSSLQAPATDPCVAF